jgi:hypothetical protein
MDAFNPENELIDKYLRGELQGRELDSFLKTLEHDPILKKDVELQQLMVRGIQERGSAELKRYIKMRSSNKNKRIYAKINKLRKSWWHFRTRWNDDNTK